MEHCTPPDPNKLTKKDKIDIVFKTLGLGSLVIAFLVYYSGLVQQQQNFSQQEIQNLKDSLQAVKNDNRYKLQQLRADTLLMLRQIEVQQELTNYIKAANLNNELNLQKIRINNQASVYTDAVINVKTIISSSRHGIDYSTAVNSLFNNNYPKIELFGHKEITTLLDSFNMSLKKYEYVLDRLLLRDSLLRITVNVVLEVDGKRLYLENVEDSLVVVSNNVREDINFLRNQIALCEWLTRKLSNLIEGQDLSIIMNGQPNHDLSQIEQKFINYMHDFQAALEQFLNLRISNANKDTLSIVRSESSDKIFHHLTARRLIDNQRTVLDSRNIYFDSIERHKNDLENISTILLVEMKKQNKILNGKFKAVTSDKLYE